MTHYTRSKLASTTVGLEIYGDNYPTPDGTCVRDYIHVHDLAAPRGTGVSRQGKFGGAQLGNGRGHSVRAVLSTVKRVTGRKVPQCVGPPRPGDPGKLVANPTCAEELLRWKARRSLEEIIATAWKWEENRRSLAR
jgi:UDP-glucose 4-epimerase